jgi:hypothetical protein
MDASPPTIHYDAEHPHEEFFAPWREARRNHYANRTRRRWPFGRRRRRAVLTIVHNEPVFLPLWLRYYSRFFAADDIYVLDHETADGSTSGPGFVRIPVAHDRVDAAWMTGVLASAQRDLLERYDVVLVADADEIVAPPPSWGTLGQYLDRFDEDFVNPLGYEILHLRDREPALSLNRPVMDQRGYWFANDGYDKPILATVPMEWTPGLHRSADGRHNYDPDLYLIHLRRMDYSICRARQRRLAAEEWARSDVERGWGNYNRLDGADYERWFYEDSGFEEAGIHIALEPIPNEWKGLV